MTDHKDLPNIPNRDNLERQAQTIVSLEAEVAALKEALHAASYPDLSDNVRTRVRVKKVKYVQGKLVEVDKQVNMLLQEGWDLGELHLQYGKFPIQVMNLLEEVRI